MEKYKIEKDSVQETMEKCKIDKGSVPEILIQCSVAPVSHWQS